MISGDPDRLQQVVWNLLTNAIKFTATGGRVEVRVECIVEGPATLVQLQVSDTGKGITPEFIPYVFERFRQAESTSTRAYAGIGLGLAIVRHLVELHGGTAQVESPGEGQGTTFTVKLPLAGTEVSRGAAQEPLPAAQAGDDLLGGLGEPAALDGLRVLLVEDDRDNREFLTLLLQQLGAHVTAVSSSAEALEALTQQTPDVLVSDIAMPGEDGYTLIRKVRTLFAGPQGQIPALALTACSSLEDRNQALLAGFQVYLSKPVEPETFTSTVANLATAPKRRP